MALIAVVILICSQRGTDPKWSPTERVSVRSPISSQSTDRLIRAGAPRRLHGLVSGQQTSVQCSHSNAINDRDRLRPFLFLSGPIAPVLLAHVGVLMLALDALQRSCGKARSGYAVDEESERAVGDPAVHRQADLAGAAGRVTSGAARDERRERSQRMPIHLRPDEPFVAGKAAAADVGWNHARVRRMRARPR